eukprot:Em0283g2a
MYSNYAMTLKDIFSNETNSYFNVPMTLKNISYVLPFSKSYAGVAYVGLAYSEPQGPAAQSIFISLLIKIYAPGNVPGNVSTTAPTIAPTNVPDIASAIAPNSAPTIAPTIASTSGSTIAPAIAPTIVPDIAPAIAPNSAPTIAPTFAPTIATTIAPTIAPTIVPDIAPNSAPTIGPTFALTVAPAIAPTIAPLMTTDSACSGRVTCHNDVIPWEQGRVGDAAVRGYKKGLQRQSYQKKDFECACEAEDSSPSSTEMVHTTLNVVREFKGVAVDLVTGSRFNLLNAALLTGYCLSIVALRTLGLAGFPDNYAPDSKSRLPVHNSLGNLLQSMGDYTGALQEYKEAVKLGEDLNNLICLSWAHGNMGNAHLGLHQKDAALHHLKKALALTIEHETTPQAISRAYNNLGTAYQSLEDFKGAEDNFNLALNQAIYGNDVAGQARARGNLGNLLMLKKKYERAVEQYSEVSKDRQVLSIANHNRGCAYLEWAEQLRSGQNGATSGISRNLQVLYIQTHGSMQGLSLSVSLIENSSRTFHKLQDCLIGLQQMDEALVVAEQCRARTLGERLLEKMGGGVNHLTPPLSLEQIRYIVKSQEHPTQATKVAVVTKLALLRIPDESAGMFMQFFYQYLVDGPGTTHALQKATLSAAVVEKLSKD